MDNDLPAKPIATENKTYISKILGEMKHQFNNKLDFDSYNEPESEESNLQGDEIQKIESESSTKDSDDKSDKSNDTDVEGPHIVMCFRKPGNNLKSAPTNRRTRRNKVNSDMHLKRSMRRRSKDYSESILQTAIARKEKSYNESYKPQRLSRQLKPTQKILENIANAAAMKLDKKKEKYKAKITDKLNDTDETPSDESNNYAPENKYKHSLRKVKKNQRGFKRDSTDTSNEDDMVKVQKTERVQSGSNSREEIVIKEEHSATEQLISSRLCVCSQQTKLYAVHEDDEDVYCNAIDSIGDRLIGCSNLVNCVELSMIRPSFRVPYTVLCSMHRNRMLRHNCCPNCGIFCTQGKFSQCENKHQYHRDCQITVGEFKCCPHCGQPTPQYDVQINMETPTPPIFLITQKSQITLKSQDNEIVTQMDERDCESPPLVPLNELKMSNTAIKCTQVSQYSITDLLESIKETDLQEVATILGSRTVCLQSSIEFDGGSGTVLHYAAKYGLLSAIHMLKIADIDLDILDNDRNTALMLAVIHSQNDTVKYLTQAGASVIAKGVDGMTALHLAAKCGNLEACQIILSAAIHIKGYINCADDGGWTALVWSCEHSHVDVVKFLLTEGADPLLKDVEDNVALHWAAFSGSSKIVEFILNFGAEVNVVNVHGDSPLHIAARQDNYNCVLILLARSAKINIVNKAGENSVNCCPENSKSYEALSLNVHLQSLINISDKSNK